MRPSAFISKQENPRNKTPPWESMEDAAKIMLDAQDGTADARRRMLERQQGRRKSESAAAARLNMIQREGKGT